MPALKDDDGIARHFAHCPCSVLAHEYEEPVFATRSGRISLVTISTSPVFCATRTRDCQVATAPSHKTNEFVAFSAGAK